MVVDIVVGMVVDMVLVWWCTMVDVVVLHGGVRVVNMVVDMVVRHGGRYGGAPWW